MEICAADALALYVKQPLPASCLVYSCTAIVQASCGQATSPTTGPHVHTSCRVSGSILSIPAVAHILVLLLFKIISAMTRVRSKRFMNLRSRLAAKTRAGSELILPSRSKHEPFSTWWHSNVAGVQLQAAVTANLPM